MPRQKPRNLLGNRDRGRCERAVIARWRPNDCSRFWDLSLLKQRNENEGGVVDPRFDSWNQIVVWIKRIDGVRGLSSGNGGTVTRASSTPRPSTGICAANTNHFPSGAQTG